MYYRATCKYGGWTVPKVLFSFDCQPLCIWTSISYLDVNLTFERQTHLDIKFVFGCQSHIWMSSSHLTVKLIFGCQSHIWTSNTFERQTHICLSISHLSVNLTLGSTTSDDSLIQLCSPKHSDVNYMYLTFGCQSHIWMSISHLAVHQVMTA